LQISTNWRDVLYLLYYNSFKYCICF